MSEWCVGIVGISAFVNKWKIVFRAFTKPYLRLFLQLLFLWQKIMCCCVTHSAYAVNIPQFQLRDQYSLLKMYNVIRFSRLKKLISSNLYISVWVIIILKPLWFIIYLSHNFLTKRFDSRIFDRRWKIKLKIISAL